MARITAWMLASLVGAGQSLIAPALLDGQSRFEGEGRVVAVDPAKPPTRPR